jgi:hypothetical protein
VGAVGQALSASLPKLSLPKLKAAALVLVLGRAPAFGDTSGTGRRVVGCLLVHGDGVALGARAWLRREVCLGKEFTPAWTLPEPVAPAIGAVVELPVGPVAVEDGFGDGLSVVDGDGDPVPLGDVVGVGDTLGLIVPIDEDGDAELAGLAALQLFVGVGNGIAG